MTRKELYNICHDEAVTYANSEQWSKRTGEEKSFLIQGYLDAMMEARKSEITEKKKEYPKTFDKCCHIVQTAFVCDVRLHKGKYYNIFRALAKLIVCRDAYWKIAGEEMGLGKPWEPDYDSGVDKFGIVYFDNTIMKTCAIARWERHLNKILEFPTKEMRDAFYENFKEEIEICKELL